MHEDRRLANIGKEGIEMDIVIDVSADKELRWREIRAEMTDQHIERHSRSDKGLIFVTKNASR